MIPSLPKLLGLITIIWVVWTAFRIYETRQAIIREKAYNQNKDSHVADRNKTSGVSEEDESVELRECKICLAWVSGENCRRENCPY